MGRLKTLTILLTLGAWGPATDGAPPDDAAPPATPATRPQPPAHPSKYLKAAQALAKKNDPLAGQYIRAADDYRDMLTVDEQSTLDALKAQYAPAAPSDPSVNVTAATTAPTADAPPQLESAPADSPAPTPAQAPAPSGSPRDRAAAMVKLARQALENGQVEQAKNVALEAQALNAPFSPGEDHPGKILADIANTGSGLRSRATKPNDKQQAAWLLRSAREQIVMGHYDDAAAKVEQARAMNIRWTLFDDTPTKVAEALEKARPKTTQVSSGVKGDRRQARAKLKEAREMMANGQYEQAEAIAMEVATWNVRFSMVEDNPNRVASAARALRRREATRAAGPRNQPSESLYSTLVASSRQLMQAGKIDEAEAKAKQALAMNVYPSLTADRAEAVLHDIEMARAASRPSPSAAVAVNSAPTDPNVAPVAAAAPAQAPAAEPASLAAEREANELLAKGDSQAARAKFQEAEQLKAREDAAPAAPAAPAADGSVPLVPDPVSDPAAPAPIGDATAPGTAPAPAPAPVPAPAGPGGSLLEQAQSLLTNGNYPAARQAAQQAKQQGAGLEADQLLAQIGQTEQAAAFKIYEAALSSIRKGTADELAHARSMLDEMAGMDLDESTQQKVQDLLMKLPRDGAGRAQVGAGVEDKETVEAQKLNAEVGTKIAEVRKLLETDPDKAIAVLNATIDQVKASGCKESVTKTMVRRLEIQVDLAKKDKLSFDAKMKDKTYRAEIENKRLRILEADKAKKDRIKTLMDRAEAAMADGKFDEAEKCYGLVAEIDPNEIAAVAGRYVARTRRHYERDKALRSNKEEMFLNAMQDVDATMVVPEGVIKNSIDAGEGFAGLTERRRALADRLAAKKAPYVIETEKRLDQHITINMEKTTLGEAIKYLQDLTGLNIVPDKKALAEEGHTLSTPVSFQANNLKLRTVLKLLLRDLNLTYTVVDEGVVMFTSTTSGRERTVARVYNVADLVVPVGARPNNNSGMPGTVNFPGTNSPPGSPTDPSLLQAQANAMNGPAGAFTPPNQEQMAVKNGTRDDRNIDFGPLIALIKSAVAPGTWSDYHGEAEGMGGYGQGAGLAGGAGAAAAQDQPIGSITPFFLSISLIIRHTAEVHDDIVDLLRQLRRLQDLQVSIEVRFITVSDSFFEQIGVDFDFSIQSDAVGPKSSFAVPNPAVALGANTGAGATTGNTGQTTAVNPFLINPIRDHALGNKQPVIVGHTGASTGDGNPGDFTPNLQLPFTQGSAGVIAPFNALTGNTAATFGIAFLSDLEVYLFLTAVQGDTRSNLVQAPKVTSFNGANATVSNFTSRNYVASLTPIVGAGAVAFFPTIGTVPDGVILNVTPVVSADRRYVRMTLSPNFTTFIQFDTFTIPAAVGGGGLGGQSSAINAQVQLPVFSFTTVITTVTVPDGGTVLLGGVKRLREERREFGVPILSKMPLVDRLFRNIGIGRTTDSLMLMVTPRIIILEEEEEKLGIPTVQNVTF